MTHRSRHDSWRHARETEFDVAILGGGINGACLYHRLCTAGYRVLLAERGDFASGTSQASGMMIWGGLLYLRSLDLLSVYRFSQSRDAMIRDLPDWVDPAPVHYIPAPDNHPDPRLVLGGLYFYWLLGHFRRRHPGREKSGVEDRLIHNGHGQESLRYEEGILRTSDARFVLQWITPHQGPGQVPLNYGAVTGGAYDGAEKMWRLEMQDTLGEEWAEVRARWVVNCTGPWVDPVNALFGIESPYRHVLSKGVYLGIPRLPGHETPMVFEMGDHNDAITCFPWGPISLWGPTEDRVEDIDAGRAVTSADVHSLLKQAERNFSRPPGRADIVSLRCGLRPLAVPTSFRGDGYTLGISRRHRIAQDARRPWLSLYGGKITGCTAVAEEIAARIGRSIPPPPAVENHASPTMPAVEHVDFPGLEQPVPSPRWCRDHEFCHTLDDYLRRRTNISQWVAREGLGRHDANLAAIGRIALTLNHGDHDKAAHSVRRYRERVQSEFDSVLASL